MSSIYELKIGHLPILISMPHNGEGIPEDIAVTMTPKALSVPDTDWYKDKLYDFAGQLGASVLKPKNNRYVVDLNRDPEGVDLYPGANSTELCPTTAFDLSPIYQTGMLPSKEEQERRVDAYWRPYHQAIQETLAKMKAEHGIAILLEAHSILSHVPRFFDGQLPDFNFGNSNGASCSAQLMLQIDQLDFAPYTSITNGRFKGGYITRAYGDPENNIHAVQLELSQRTYMNEPSDVYNEALANEVKPKLKQLVECLLEYAAENGE